MSAIINAVKTCYVIIDMVKTIKIGAYEYDVVAAKLGYWGYADFKNKTIYYDPGFGSAKDHNATIMHEIMHCVGNLWGIHQPEDELIVRIYENAITQSLVDNKEFFKELIDSFDNKHAEQLLSEKEFAERPIKVFDDDPEYKAPQADGNYATYLERNKK
jgi:hypothetical protein